MARNTDLAAAIRAALQSAGGIREIKMFGGVCFMLDGNMVAGTFKNGLLVRVGQRGKEAALARPAAQPMMMRGREMAGYVVVDGNSLDSRSIKRWLKLATDYVRTLPRKPARKKRAARKRKKSS